MPDPRPEAAAYESVRGAAAFLPARRLMEEVFSHRPGRGQELVNDFRGRGFSARVWELALLGYFVEQGFDVDMTMPRPDFVISDEGVSVGIEATTTNPPQDGGPMGQPSLDGMPLVPADIPGAQAAFVFQMAKALGRKVRHTDAAGQRYWEVPHMADRPFVIAVEAFHADAALFHSDTPLASYLYGRTWSGSRAEDGSAVVTSTALETHEHEGRSIPSGFFAQADMQHVSAVLFSNSATVNQFLRIAIEHRMGPPGLVVVRQGTRFDPDPQALEPATFGYQVTPGEHRERFATGLRLFHNPRALRPVPQGFFGDVVEMSIEDDGLITGRHPPFAPYASITVILTAAPS